MRSTRGCGRSTSPRSRSCRQHAGHRGVPHELWRRVHVPSVPGLGHGEPIQRLFKFRDGERVLAAFSLGDARHRSGRPRTRCRRCMRLRSPPTGSSRGCTGSLSRARGPRSAPAAERSGRRRGARDGDDDCRHRTGAGHPLPGRRMTVRRGKGSSSSSSGKGPGRPIALRRLDGARDLLTVETTRGAPDDYTAKYEVTARCGRELQRGQFVRVVPQAVEAPSVPDADET